MKNHLKTITYIVYAVVAHSDCLHAQPFPTKPIRVIIPYAAGGGSDISTRIVQARATELLGQSLIVDNRAGGGTLIGARMMQLAPADGYTVGAMDPAFIINPTLMRDAGYKALKDFMPVTPSLPPKSVKEPVDQVRASPGKFNFRRCVKRISRPIESAQTCAALMTADRTKWRKVVQV